MFGLGNERGGLLFWGPAQQPAWIAFIIVRLKAAAAAVNHLPDGGYRKYTFLGVRFTIQESFSKLVGSRRMSNEKFSTFEMFPK